MNEEDDTHPVKYVLARPSATIWRAVLHPCRGRWRSIRATGATSGCLTDLFHVRCADHPDVAFCGERDETDRVAREHLHDEPAAAQPEREPAATSHPISTPSDTGSTS
jgi:hypothetical protein